MSMKNYVILLAGGIGKRMGSNLPKQFIKVEEKPILVHTAERFQKNPQIEKIVVVCVSEWLEYLRCIVVQYGLTKIQWIIEGGSTGHDSIRNGVRPVLPQKAIDEVIRVAHEKGNAASSIVCHPPIVYTEDFESGITDIDREHVILTASPQAFQYSLAYKCYEQAELENLHNTTFTSSLLIHCKERVFFAKGTTSNIKITTREDLALFEALLKIPEELLYS